MKPRVVDVVSQRWGFKSFHSVCILIMAAVQTVRQMAPLRARSGRSYMAAAGPRLLGRRGEEGGMHAGEGGT